MVYPVLIKIHPALSISIDVTVQSKGKLQEFRYFMKRRKALKIKNLYWWEDVCKFDDYSEFEEIMHVEFPIKTLSFLSISQARDMLFREKFLYNIGGFFSWMGEEEVVWVPKLQANRKKRYAFLKHDNLELKCMIWEHSINDIVGLLKGKQEGLIHMTYMKKRICETTVTFETSFETTIS